MSLTWHIVRKDLRRLRLPLALWLALILAHTVLLTRAAGLIDAAPIQLEGLKYFANTWEVIVRAIGFILAAWLVMEDSLVETRAFWPTRPIGGARLLAAKVLGALLMFSVLPALGLTPVWLGCGFSIREWGGAALAWGLTQGLLSTAAFALAGVTTSAGQFLIRAVGLAALLPVLFLFAIGRIVVVPNLIVRPDFVAGVGLEGTRYWLAFGLTIGFAVTLVVHQYLVPRTARYGVLIGLWLMLLLGVRFAWVWDLTPRIEAVAPAPGDGQIELLPVLLSILPAGSSEGRVQIKLEGQSTDVPAGTYVRLDRARGDWVGPGGREPLTHELRAPLGTGRPPPEAVQQVVRLTPAGGSRADWEIDGWEPASAVDRARTRGASLQVAMEATLMRGLVLGELPLREGAELRHGAAWTRIARIASTDGKLVVRLTERDASPAEDAYVLVHRASGYEQILEAGEIGSIQINSIRVAQRVLVFDPPTREGNEINGWENSMALVKVRFAPDRPIKTILTARP